MEYHPCYTVIEQILIYICILVLKINKNGIVFLKKSLFGDYITDKTTVNLCI